MRDVTLCLIYDLDKEEINSCHEKTRFWCRLV